MKTYSVRHKERLARKQSGHNRNAWEDILIVTIAIIAWSAPWFIAALIK